jgi:hypothetical protein
MTLRDTILGLKSRTQDRATRVNSGDFNAHGDRDVEIEDPTVYKVYKRRWIGVAIIMLLNIVSSWRYLYALLSQTPITLASDFSSPVFLWPVLFVSRFYCYPNL